MNNITFGKYLSLDFIIHHMDSRAKIGAMLIMMIVVFIPAGYAGYGVIAATVIGAASLIRLKLPFLWRAMKPILFMLMLLFIINLLVIRDGDALFTIFGSSIYTGTIAQTLYTAICPALMIVVAAILTATIRPLELTPGIEGLLKPSQVIHVPAHRAAMTISIMLRLIPTPIEGTQRIMRTQASRGVDMREGSLVEKVKAILSLIVPLFVSAFQCAEDLTYAMEARGYIPNRMRTHYKQLKMGDRDYVLPIASVLVFTAMVAMVLYVQI